MWQGMKLVLLCTARYLNRSEKQCRYMKHVCSAIRAMVFFCSLKHSCKTLACKILTNDSIQNWVGNIYGFSLRELWKTVRSFHNVTHPPSFIGKWSFWKIRRGARFFKNGECQCFSLMIYGFYSNNDLYWASFFSFKSL